ncbi:type II restriction endonuclease [Candidatus Pacearchaeota archaeon CG_4_10_14_0_2_um_filter_35_33]|nr:MAG: type II restriction endonuclease [Candidatus Pacearchaeota archaeon CG1_02_35_32]PIZ80918.1 MAG: type II restriction endonuclease [Candidatus Pacearchaeota archaeon CG_4_10_14_0_2_um_filter_35_33]
MNDLIRIGSETAKGGFVNEKAIAKKFDNWKEDKEAQKWLKIMGYNLNEIEKVEAVILHGYKTDVQIKVTITLKEAISVQNLSIKKANNDADYNQIDKRWVKNYIELWSIPENIVNLLEIFCGKISPKQLLREEKITKQKYESLRDKRRFFVDEFENRDKKLLIDFFKKNKLLVITDIIKGRGQFAADWILVTRYDKKKDETSWVLADINKAMSIFGEGEVKISPRGSISIGRITLQRKGGDGGRETGNMIQFKIKPCNLFKY